MKSPTAITIDIALRDVSGGPWRVEDDPDSYDILVTDPQGRTYHVHWVLKMSGSWVHGESLPPAARAAVREVLGYEYSGGRAWRHREWRARDRILRLVPVRGVVALDWLAECLQEHEDDLLDMLARVPEVTVGADGCVVVGRVP